MSKAPATSSDPGAWVAMSGSQQPPTPNPDGTGQIGADTTKVFAMDGQTQAQGIGAKPLLVPGVAPGGGAGNVQSDDDSTPERLNPTKGANPGVKGGGL